ncbi:sodium channel and clathrin linker 1 isoform X2 [Pectinophora gossypiella]|uniref:sodium channel and clathrin linker 1 isoform X2 n=1 Tax=Pectinophora gossypiella TaxID=13191 RepID=UPI00214F0816|nr:sodium channel and clathrin linker 1 isoform X2 [Pectinophora gossypiella]
MFNFFKKKGGKDAPTTAPENNRTQPIENTRTAESVETRARNDDVTNEPYTSKDVVNLLIPETQYGQKTEKSGVGALLQIMAGKRKNKNKRKTARAESVRVSPPKETTVSLQRSKSEREVKCSDAPTPAKNTADPADFVKSLVLQKYSKPHVSLVYVSNDDLNVDPEKQHAEALLREIARTIDCTIDKINESKPMGGADSKNDKKEPLYETIDERRTPNPIDNYKSSLKGELDKLLEENKEREIEDNKVDAQSIESPSIVKKSNLKPPKSDTEGCSDDDRSDCGKKKVTFQKHIVFDDGDEQTDEEVDSSFESLTSGEEEEYLEDSLPDNDDFGGFVAEENRTVINVSENEENDGLRRISSDNSDSGFIDERQDELSEVKTLEESESESESEVSESESETEEEIIEEVVEVNVAEVIDPNNPKHVDNQKSLVSQESKFQHQVSALTELADSRCEETERVRDLITAYRKEIEEKNQEIEQLKCELAKAYKESELVRQRSRSLEEELGAARACSADLADQLKKRNDDALRQLRAELEDVLSHRAELESRVQALERDCERLQREKSLQEQRAQEALAAAEANTAKWRAAHESARSQAAARAERMLADCEWKMRELEQKARDADKQKKELTTTIEQLKAAPQPAPAHVAELQQLRGVVTEQQRSVHALSLQLQKVETREEALKLEVHRLKDLLDKEIRIGKEKEERHLKTVERLEQQQSKTVEALRAEHTAAAAASRATLERAHAERTRAALAQLRAEAEQDARNADRRLREVTTKFENLKELLATKERQFELSLAEAHSKADWDIMQLRHMLDKADINNANTVERLTENYEQERERLNQEWEEKIRAVEEQAATAAEDARRTLEGTRQKLMAERVEQVNKLKEQHRQEMDEQWERFMSDKETCLQRMKAECRQEGEEERVKREKELLEEIEDLKAQLKSSTVDFDHLAVKAAACGRTLAVTEQELREALAREKELREKRSEDATKLRQAERASKDQVEHLTRKCACLRKLFDDMRARLSARERAAEQDSRAKEKEIHQLRAEVARLTKLLVEESSPKLGARTRADGCETALSADERKGM